MQAFISGNVLNVTLTMRENTALLEAQFPGHSTLTRRHGLEIMDLISSRFCPLQEQHPDAELRLILALDDETPMTPGKWLQYAIEGKRKPDTTLEALREKWAMVAQATSPFELDECRKVSILCESECEAQKVIELAAKIGFCPVELAAIGQQMRNSDKTKKMVLATAAN